MQKYSDSIQIISVTLNSKPKTLNPSVISIQDSSATWMSAESSTATTRGLLRSGTRRKNFPETPREPLVKEFRVVGYSACRF